MNTIAGASLLAAANSSLTLIAPMPTYSSTNSEAEMEKKGTPASPGVLVTASGQSSARHHVLIDRILILLIACMQDSMKASSSLSWALLSPVAWQHKRIS
jgi:hypothetical protein